MKRRPRITEGPICKPLAASRRLQGVGLEHLEVLADKERVGEGIEGEEIERATQPDRSRYVCEIRQQDA